MVTINARDGLTILDRAARNVNHAAVEAHRRDEAARATSERINVLRHIVFRNSTRGHRSVAALTSEPAAARLLVSASNSADGFLVLAIVRVAIDNRWGDVVNAGVRYFEAFEEHPIAARIQELWNLTTGRSAV
ncbi:hypothetical protein AFM11_34335 [Mycolicibacterium wolinskyi]|uniref:Uncharacterized protein n=1 Tax=Mycolicibacterium wolinskyi TaxID=59750 RepID=A0A132PBL7_9MYCO|nr:hypothetical protein AFM11_34335 [Mycolicibacterium wolinskyi]